jgi:hypothetical protein
MRAQLESWWLKATPIQRILVAGVPAVVIALGAAGALYAGFSGGGDEKQAVAPTATRAPAIATRVPDTPTPAPSATPTEEPVSAGLQSDEYTGDYTGGTTTYEEPAPSGGALLRNDAYLQGPGPITGTDMSLSIPAIGVNATIYGRTVGLDGQMGNPSGAYDVIWYDFSHTYIGVGGRPEDPGANVVLAGHVDYIGVGPAVFWSIRDLAPGDVVTVYTANGSYNYSVQWSQWAGPYDDFSSYVNQQGVGTITLVTCIGGFSGGHYSNRLVVRGVLL